MKLSIIAIVLLGVFLIFFKTGTSQITSKAYKIMLDGLYKNTVPLISVKEASQSADQAIILDARETEEYQVSHIANAQHVGFDHFNPALVEQLPKDTLIYVYCSVGYRSERIGEQLQTIGFTNVYNLNGGIFEWKNQDHEVVDQNQQATEQVHAYSKSWGIWLKKGVKVY